jgi:acetyl-CoA carboxylase carboxyltransferase component
MVGRDAEQAGIIRSGAKMVNAVSNSVVPKITIITGGSFGAGNYAMCGKAYDPRFIFSWPNGKYAVMGADQAADTIFTVQQKAVERGGKKLSEAEMKELHAKLKAEYQHKTDIRYGAARGWVDGIIAPDTTRDVLIQCLRLVTRPRPNARFHTGVLQV